ncbi:MAG: glycosyltransferase family 2 protein [Acidobacteria bacterium]|nr:glycosyltransferase family 2 protein [Acidobacteriota bacterium]
MTPAYNEAGILEENVRTLCAYLDSLSSRYRWELIIVNDGSKDATGEIADRLALDNPAIRAVHHVVNMNLGQALRTGFAHCRGEYVVVLDVDLSYEPEHVDQLVSTLVTTRADIVVASPYMDGGRVTNVPWLRLFLSRWANRFLAYFCHHESIHTITGMVRGYRREFLDQLDLRALSVEINTEIVYKAMLLRGRIIEIPAHLDWSLQRKEGAGRISSFKIAKSIATYLLSGFVFRPFMFFLLPGAALALASVYIFVWIVFNIADAYPTIPPGPYFDDRFSHAVAMVFEERPHAFFVGGITAVFSAQLLTLGFLSYQSKKYFEELFHLSSRRGRR